MFVDFDELWLQLGPEAQTGVAGPQIINRNLKAHAAVVFHRRPRQPLMIERMLLGQFDYNRFQWNIQLSQQVGSKAMLVVRRAEQGRGHVQKQ